jgi:hypothetical protein
LAETIGRRRRVERERERDEEDKWSIGHGEFLAMQVNAGEVYLINGKTLASTLRKSAIF